MISKLLIDNLSIRILLISYNIFLSIKLPRNTWTWPRLMVYDNLGQYGIRHHNRAEETLDGGVLFFFFVTHTKLGSPFSMAPYRSPDV